MAFNLLQELHQWDDQPGHPYIAALQGAIGLGGWEKWAQTDFTLFCMHNHPAMNGQFILEDHVYEDEQLRDDITVFGQSINELKTRSRSGETFPMFVNRFHQDYLKLRGGDPKKKKNPRDGKLFGNSCKVPYQTWSRWAIGLATYESIRFTDGNNTWTRAQVELYVEQEASKQNLDQIWAGDIVILWKLIV